MQNKIAVRNTGSDADIDLRTLAVGDRYDLRIQRMNALENNEFALFSEKLFITKNSVAFLEIITRKAYGFKIDYLLKLFVQKLRINSFRRFKIDLPLIKKFYVLSEYRLEINFYRLGLLLILYNKKRILAIEILKEMLYNQGII